MTTAALPTGSAAAACEELHIDDVDYANNKNPFKPSWQFLALLFTGVDSERRPHLAHYYLQ